MNRSRNPVIFEKIFGSTQSWCHCFAKAYLMRMSAFAGLMLVTFRALVNPACVAADPVPQLPPIPQKIVDAAIATPMIRYGRTISGGAHTDGAFCGGSAVVLGLAAWQGNAAADKRLLEQIRYTLQSNRSISANGAYPAQHEVLIISAYTFAKWTPRIWNQFTPAEQKSIDLLMKAALVASAFTTSDASVTNFPKPTAIDGDHNFCRDWNPNFQEGMVGELIIASLYFGGGPAAGKILDAYEHDAFVAELNSVGLSNTWETFNWKLAHSASDAPSGKTIAANVKNFHFHDIDLSDPFQLYARLTIRTYGAKVAAGLNNGKGLDGGGKIASGTDQLPNLGKDGMLLEFASHDREGDRASIGYAYHGFRPNLVTHLVLIAAGGWKKGTKADECLTRMDIGITDVFYKLEHGYIDYSHGHPGTKPFTIDQPGWDILLMRSLWQDVLKPYHESQRSK